MSEFNNLNSRFYQGIKFNLFFDSLLFGKVIDSNLTPPSVSLIAINEDNLNIVTDSAGNTLTT
jgi:hypothetical protein